MSGWLGIFWYLQVIFLVVIVVGVCVGYIFFFQRKLLVYVVSQSIQIVKVLFIFETEARGRGLLNFGFYVYVFVQFFCFEFFRVQFQFFNYYFGGQIKILQNEKLDLFLKFVTYRVYSFQSCFFFKYRLEGCSRGQK